MSQWRDQGVGLIGANGFIGSTILKNLVRSGITPRLLCGPDSKSLPISSSFDCLTCDLNDAEKLKCWVAGLDLIIHAAGPPSVRRSFEIPEEYVRVHVQGTATLLDACQTAEVKRFVYVSSAEVYGRPLANPVTETSPLRPRSPYAAAKIGAEKLVEAYVESFGLNAVILRPFSIYGQDPSPESLLGNIIATARAGSGVRLGDLTPLRDYCHVEDLATAVLKASAATTAGLEIFNIGTGHATSVGDFAKLVLQLLDTDLPLLEDPSRVRPGQSEIFELIADVSKARDLLDWQPRIGLREGLRHALGLTSNVI
jgi:nucleoside-diphosphate-sugar epimerase